MVQVAERRASPGACRRDCASLWPAPGTTLSQIAGSRRSRYCRLGPERFCADRLCGSANGLARDAKQLRIIVGAAYHSRSSRNGDQELRVLNAGLGLCQRSCVEVMRRK